MRRFINLSMLISQKQMSFHKVIAIVFDLLRYNVTLYNEHFLSRTYNMNIVYCLLFIVLFAKNYTNQINLITLTLMARKPKRSHRAYKEWAPSVR